MNFQLCRPAVNDSHKVRPCNYTGIVALPPRIPPEVFRHLEYFWRTSCYMYPLRLANIDPHSLFFLYLPQVGQTSVATVCMPMSSQLQDWWVRVCSVRTKDMELLTLSVLYIQGSHAGQKYFKI